MTKKKIHAVFSAVLLLLSIITSAQTVSSGSGNEKYEFEKERSISKSYPASGNSVSLENSFGAVKIIAWDKNEVKVDISIKVKSTDKETGERTFENINVEEGLWGNTIKFKTSQADYKGNSCKKCNTDIKINYEVHMPVNLKLNVANSFGPTNIPDYNGQIDIKSKFGVLTAGVLTDVKALSVEFGKATVKSMGDVSAVFKFSTVDIASLKGANKIKMEFCDSSRIVMASNLTALTLEESYSTINLRPANGLGVSYTVKTNFGTFIDRSNAGVVRTDTPDRYGPDSNRTYEGKSGNGAVKVDLKSTFGRIILGEAREQDMKKSSRSYSRNAGRVI
jgi:hypothetical protein